MLWEEQQNWQAFTYTDHKERKLKLLKSEWRGLITNDLAEIDKMNPFFKNENLPKIIQKYE